MAHAWDHDRALEMYLKAEAAAKAGNARMADAIRRLEDLNIRLAELDRQRSEAQQQYAKLEAAIIEEAEAL